ncbi:MAG: T9SS type A sorting domain-containing protein [Bacteroidia bacterium]
MKKIITSLTLLLVTQLSIAQIAWDSVATGGLPPYQARFYDMTVYNGKIYAASDSGYLVPTLFSSTSGDFGTWTRENGLTPFLQGSSEDLLSRLASDGTNLFIGSANYSGGFQAPQVYRFDGATYKKHGTIPYSGMPYNYSDISAMEFFSASGAPDSVFAFVSSFVGMEVWKTSASATSPTWVPSLVMAGSAEIVNDAIVYGGKLFAATCGNGSGGFILRTADGITWDTVGYGGFGNSSNISVKTFAIFNGELYAGTLNNTTGAELYKTSNGTLWTQVSLGSLGLGANLRSVSELTVAGGRMFATLRYYNVGYNYVRTCYTGDGINFTFAGGTGTQETTQLFGSGFGDLRMELFNGAIYSASNTNTNYGSLWRLKLPVASFTPQNPIVCQNSTVNYTNTSTNASSYVWNENTVAVNLTSTYSGVYSTTGTYTLQLKAFNGSIYDSTQYAFTVVSKPSVLPSGVPSLTVCPGQQTTVTAVVTGGTPPYDYTWTTFSPGYPNPGSTDSSFTYAPTTPGTYTVTVLDANSCISAPVNIFMNLTSAPTALFGNISYSGGGISQGNIYILKYQPTYSGTDTFAIVPIQANGDYFKDSVLYGQYLIKADPDLILFPTTISTYNGGFFRWDSAAPFLHGCSQTDTNNIQVLELPPQTGTASIAGTITEGIGYGMRFLGPGGGTPPAPFVPGGPIRGVDVKLGKNPGGGIQARTMSDTNGIYVFTNIPIGSYRIYVDIPNLPMDSTRDVNVTAASDSLINNDYWADSVQIYIPNVTAIQDLSNHKLQLSAYPNPASDKIFVQLDLNKEGAIQYELSDISGKKIMSGSQRLSKGKNKLEISLGGVEPGIYLMSYTVNSSRYTTKLVILE